MGRREDLLRLEAEGWQRLERALDGVDPSDLERPELPEDWSVCDALWHVAWWARDSARVLGEMTDGTWDGSDPSKEPGWTDARNAELLERSRSIAAADVLDEWRAARTALLEAFATVPEVTPDAQEWFEEAAHLHYAQHAADIEAWRSARPPGPPPPQP